MECGAQDAHIEYYDERGALLTFCVPECLLGYLLFVRGYRNATERRIIIDYWEREYGRHISPMPIDVFYGMMKRDEALKRCRDTLTEQDKLTLSKEGRERRRPGARIKRIM